jgi:hypothetical protein
MKVIKQDEDEVRFDNGLKIIGDGDVDCCAHNFLDFEQLPVGTELPTATALQMAKRIKLKDDGFSVKDIEGTPKWVQARSHQNGYYSNRTTVILEYKDTKITLGELSGLEDE